MFVACCCGCPKSDVAGFAPNVLPPGAPKGDAEVLLPKPPNPVAPPAAGVVVFVLAPNPPNVAGFAWLFCCPKGVAVALFVL